MKRLWIGAALLAAVLLAGIAITAAFDRQQTELATYLEQAADAALEDNWADAAAYAAQAAGLWERSRYALSAGTDHAPLTDVDVLFARLQVWGQRRTAGEFAAACAELSCLCRALAASHKLTWWNLL